MLLDSQTGYFHQVPAWTLNCAVAGAVLAELSLQSKIDTDMKSLHVLDSKETGNPSLDIFLNELAAESAQQNIKYWFERLTIHTEDIIDTTLDQLVKLGILNHHDGEFWTLSPENWRESPNESSTAETANQFISSRISDAIFCDTIPAPRDIIIISLINVCDLFRFIFELDEQAEKRIENLCRIELIARTISATVKDTIASPILRRPGLTKKIQTVSLTKMLFNPHLRSGNIPALFASLADQYGSAFWIRLPLKKPILFLAGAEPNRWMHRKGRMYLTSKRFYSQVQAEYGAFGLITTTDGYEHFRLRKAFRHVYSVDKIKSELDQVFSLSRHVMKDWQVGSEFNLHDTSQLLANSQIMPLLVSTESNDLFFDIMKWKNLIVLLHIFLHTPVVISRLILNLPPMKRCRKALDEAVTRVQRSHTPEQRKGKPKDLGDETLSLLSADQQFIPESNLTFMLSAPMLGSQYFGDTLGCIIYTMVTQPELYAEIRKEADALFANGDPSIEDLTEEAYSVTSRFILECQRLYPVVYMIPRHIVNSCVVDGFELPVGELVFFVQTATHFMEDAFPDPFKFDIDRYQPPNRAHRSPSYAPFGLGTHICLSRRWVHLHLIINVLMIAHYFELEMSDPDFKFKINAYPSLSVSKKLKIRIADKLHEFPPPVESG